jgi:hypothetical protein
MNNLQALEQKRDWFIKNGILLPPCFSEIWPSLGNDTTSVGYIGTVTCNIPNKEPALAEWLESVYSLYF